MVLKVVVCGLAIQPICSKFYIFEVKGSIAAISTEPQCLSDPENPSQLPVVFIFICNNILAEMKFPLSPAVNEIILSSRTRYIFLLPPRSLPEFFVAILVARNCAIPSLSFTKSLRRDSHGLLHRGKRTLCFYHLYKSFIASAHVLSLTTFLKLLGFLTSALASPTIPECFARCLASPSELCHFGSSTLDLLKHRVMH